MEIASEEKLQRPGLQTRKRLGARWEYVVPAILLLLYLAQCVWFIGTQSLTLDEPINILSGLEQWRTGQYSGGRGWNDNPPLARLLCTLPAINPKYQVVDLPSATHDVRAPERKQILPGPRSMAWHTRPPNAILGAVLGLLLWLVARSLYSTGAANFVLALFVFSPSLIANFSLAATSDGLMTLMMFTAVWQLSRWRHDSSPKQTALLGLVLGGLLLAKPSSLPLFGLAIVLMLIPKLRKISFDFQQWRWKQAGIALAVCFFIVWGVYRFHITRFTITANDLHFSIQIPQRETPIRVASSRTFRVTLPIPAYEFLQATWFQIKHNHDPAQGYLLGRSYEGRSLWFFPVVILLKWPTTVLLLAGSTLFLLGLRRIPRPRDWALWAAFPGLYFLLALFAGANLGERQILPLYPFVLLLCGSVWTVATRHRGMLALLLLATAAQAVDGLRYAPDYLSYFNPFVRPSDSYELLSGGDVDWGEGLIALRHYQELHPDEPVYLAYNGTVEPISYGIHALPLMPNERVSGTLIVSANYLNGQSLPSSPGGYRWIVLYPRIVILNHSLHVFRVPAVNTFGPQPLPQANWTLVSVDSQETECESGAAVNAFDGSPSSFWHTWWCNGTSPGPPHQLTIDLGAHYSSLIGFQYTPRTDGCSNGWVRDYKFDVSGNGNDWVTAAAGSFNYGSANVACPGASVLPAFTINFPAVSGRYVRFQALREINGGPSASAAEINVLSSDPSASGSVAISPRVVTMTVNQSRQFTASAENVNWTVDGIAGGNADIGTVTGTGLYHPPPTPGIHNIGVASMSNPLAFGRATVYVESATEVIMQHNDLARTGQNLNEIALSPLNVNQAQFGRLFSYRVDGHVYAQPLYVPNVPVAGQSAHNVVYVATEHDSLFAFDADGLVPTPLWHVSFINPSAGVTTIPCTDVYDNGADCDITPEVGITSTPAIDAGTGTIYVEAATKEKGSWVQRLHALDLASGTERPGSPVLIEAKVPGTGYDNVNGQVIFNARRQLQRPGLILANGYVYLCFGSYGDITPFHGWVMAYDGRTLRRVYVYNTTPNGGEGSIWQSGQAPSVDASGNLFLMSSNSTDDAQSGGSFLRLSPSLQLQDYMTPFNRATLQPLDLDLGSGGPLLLPDQSARATHLLVGAGKEGRIYLIDRDNMGQFHADKDNVVEELPGAVGSSSITPGNSAMYGSPAYWNGLVYFIADADNAKAFRLSRGLLSAAPVAKSTMTFHWPGATPSISAQGSSNGILWAIDGSGPTAGPVPAVLHAFDASDISHELYNSGQAPEGRDTMPLGVKFSVPTVANGKVYVATQTQLVVFGRLHPLVVLPGGR